jgi:hypothetical protein
MRSWLVAVLFSRLAAAALQPATDLDAAAIRMVVDHWREMWDHFDASSLRDDYLKGADFVNAFGRRLKGRSEILAFANRVVQRSNVQSRHTPSVADREPIRLRREQRVVVRRPLVRNDLPESATGIVRNPRVFRRAQMGRR